MAQQLIDITVPGDTLAVGGDKINDNFTELYGWRSTDAGAISTLQGTAPTAGEKAALAGTGTPGAGDPYVNDSDDRLPVNVATAFLFPNETGTTVTSAVYNSAGLHASTGGGAATCRIFGRRMWLNRAINLSKAVWYASAYSNSGHVAMRLAVYDKAGTTLLAAFPWVYGVAGGTMTFTLATPVPLPPGEYLIVYAGVVWNTKTVTIRSNVLDVNNWGPQLTAVAGKLNMFRSDQVISVADVTNPLVTETFPASLGTLSYNASSFDEDFPLTALYPA